MEKVIKKLQEIKEESERLFVERSITFHKGRGMSIVADLEQELKNDLDYIVELRRAIAVLGIKINN